MRRGLGDEGMGVLDHDNKKLSEQDDVLAKLAAPKAYEQPGSQK